MGQLLCQAADGPREGIVMVSNESPASEVSPEAQARNESLKAISAETRALGEYSGQHHWALVELAHAYALVTGSLGAPATSSPEQRL
ncbi:hypothetical protein [Kitasatospora paranensis]|uniref:Uncharacterized protein n=1 Tax=Kitasatospora paranensis TaxID=258053 RepID=A0ABW2G4N9_9ACTN